MGRWCAGRTHGHAHTCDVGLGGSCGARRHRWGSGMGFCMGVVGVRATRCRGFLVGAGPGGRAGVVGRPVARQERIGAPFNSGVERVLVTWKLRLLAGAALPEQLGLVGQRLVALRQRNGAHAQGGGAVCLWRVSRSTGRRTRACAYARVGRFGGWYGSGARRRRGGAEFVLDVGRVMDF